MPESLSPEAGQPQDSAPASGPNRMEQLFEEAQREEEPPSAADADSLPTPQVGEQIPYVDQDGLFAKSEVVSVGPGGEVVVSLNGEPRIISPAERQAGLNYLNAQRQAQAANQNLTEEQIEQIHQPRSIGDALKPSDEARNPSRITKALD